MKTKLFLLALVPLFIPAFQTLRADSLAADAITVTGSIIQETGTNGATKILPITIANILSVLGITGTAAPAVNTLRYYADNTTNGTVIALKSAAVSGSGTPVASLGGPGANTVGWNPGKHSGTGAGDMMALNGNLAGTFYYTDAYPANISTNKVKATAFGQINGIPTILNATVVDTSKISAH
jgi:hypothetical protein